jgi:hypothetical protein
MGYGHSCPYSSFCIFQAGSSGWLTNLRELVMLREIDDDNHHTGIF